MTVLEDVYFYGENVNKGSHLYCAPLTDLTSWSELSLPPDVSCCGLATYQSQLVLVGKEGLRTNKVWASADGHNWQSLPPMSRYYTRTVALSSANPECLIVVGNMFYSECTMEVLFCGKWTHVPLPNAIAHCNAVGIILNGSLYVYDPRGGIIYCCTVESLLASCTQAEEDGRACTLWNSKTIQCPPSPYYHSIFFSRVFTVFT